MTQQALVARLSEFEARSLAECEAIIERGLATFVEVGEALLAIRDGQKYRDTHGTFEDYCRERWGFKRSYAYEVMQAAEAAQLVSGIPDTPAPRSAGVAAELAPLRKDPDAARDTWAEVVEIHGTEPTAGQVREVVAEREIHDGQVPTPSRTRGQLSNQKGGTDAWATPQDFFDRLDAEFSFDLDVCALPSSAKCERYFTPEDDGLAQEWTGTCWMNPPYGDEIVRWVEKAHASAMAGATVVCLVPARVDTGWWWNHCRHGEIRFLRGRLRFGGADTSAPFPSAVVVFSPEARRVPDWMWCER